MGTKTRFQVIPRVLTPLAAAPDTDEPTVSDGKKYLTDWVLLTETYDAPAKKKPAKKRKIAQTGGPAQKK